MGKSPTMMIVKVNRKFTRNCNNFNLGESDVPHIAVATPQLEDEEIFTDQGSYAII